MANQLINGSAAAIHMYQALYGQAPSAGLYDSYMTYIAANGDAAFAKTLTANFAATSDAALALQVLNNLGVTAATVTATGEYATLLAAVTTVFGAYPTMRGQVILNITNLFANLEADATYGAAATTYNKQALADFNYANNAANVVPGVAALPDPTIGTTYTLTTGVDTLVGTALNDTFNAGYDVVGSFPMFSALDSIDGGAGTNGLNITQTAEIALPASATVANVQTATLVSSAGISGDVSGWTGLTTLRTSSAGVVAVTAATTTAATVVNTSASSVDVIGGGGALSITTGAAAITANNAAANAFTSVTTKGGTTVTVIDHSGASAAVGSTLTTATITGNAGLASLTGKGLTTVNLASNAGTGSATIVNATASHTLNLGVNAVTAGVAITDTTATTVNLIATGAKATTASDINLTTVLATALNINTSAALTLTTTSLASADVLKAVSVTGAGSLAADLSGISSLTAVDASASTGANTVTVDATVASYTGGAGVDTVTIAAVATKVINGGVGVADEIVVNTATFATNPTKIVGFETLGMGNAATGGTFDATGFAHLHSGLGITGASAFNNIAAGTDLTVDAALTAALTYTLKDATSLTSDAATIHFGSATTAGVAAGTVVTTGVELVTIDSLGTGTGTNTAVITNAGALTLTVTGGEAVTLTGFAGASLKTIDASAATKLVNVSALTVDATGVTVLAGKGGITVVGGAGVDTITGGAGVDTIDGAAGKDVIVGGGGADQITGGAGADSITVSGITSNIIQAVGASGTNSSTAIQTAELTSTFDVIFGAAAGDTITTGNASVVTATTTLVATNLAVAGYTGTGVGLDNSASFARGTYDGAAGTFTYAANGLDTALTYDSTVGATETYETIILVGYHTAATTAAVAGVITLA